MPALPIYTVGCDASKKKSNCVMRAITAGYALYSQLELKVGRSDPGSGAKPD